MGTFPYVLAPAHPVINCWDVPPARGRGMVDFPMEECVREFHTSYPREEITPVLLFGCHSKIKDNDQFLVQFLCVGLTGGQSMK